MRLKNTYVEITNEKLLFQTIDGLKEIYLGRIQSIKVENSLISIQEVTGDIVMHIQSSIYSLELAFYIEKYRRDYLGYDMIGGVDE
jgi:hypothetical protein